MKKKETENKLLEIKNEYKQIREEEKKAIKNFLNGKDLFNPTNQPCLYIMGGRGHGIKNYTNARTIAPTDLTNWKWIEIKEKNTEFSEFDCIISLNMPDLDKKTGNFHALFDRIGLIITYRIKDNYFKIIITTGMDLPLDDDKKRNALYELISDQYNNYKNMKGDNK